MRRIGVKKEDAVANLIAALKQDAEKHRKAGTLKLPVDVEEFAKRLGGSNPFLVRIRKIFGIPLTHEDYKAAIRKVCKDLKLPMKKEAQLIKKES